MRISDNWYVITESARSAIKLRKRTFAGGIIVNETNQFEVSLNSDAPRYVGKPTQELDDAWDAIVGEFSYTFTAVRSLVTHEYQGTILR